MNQTLKFLKEFPDKWILLLVSILCGLLFLHIRNDFTSQLLNSVVSALIGLLIGRSTEETKINTKVVETQSIQNESMNDATINLMENVKEKE